MLYSGRNKNAVGGSSPMSSTDLQKQFSELYDQYADAIFRHCYFRLNDRDRAIDLMQETFMRSWRYAMNGNEIHQPRAFLYRVANNLIVNEYERRKPTSSLENLDDESGFQPTTDDHEQTQTRLDAELLTQHLSKLNESYREVVVMRYIDGLSLAEIAEILEESENNVSVRIHRALKALQTYIDTTYDHDQQT